MPLDCQASTSCPNCTNWTPGGNYFAGGSGSTASYANPKQGSCFYNCAFIAALSSLEWANPKYFPFQDYAAQGNKYNFIFYPNGVATPVTVDNQLIITSTTPVSYCGAKSNNAGEIWPAIIEKAFAKMCIQRKWPTRFPAGSLTTTYFPPLYDSKYPNDHPYWGNPIFIPNASGSDCEGLSPTDWGGNPAIIMDWLTGGSKRVIKTVQSIVAPKTPYTFISEFCSVVKGMNKTKYACAAWTYASDAAAGLPAGSYSPTGIQVNHSYSVLGILQSNIPADPNNVIFLRDPCGVGATSAPCIGGAFRYNDARFTITRVWGSALREELTNAWTTLNLPNGAGVFGITSANFKKYFEFIGYTS